MGIRAPICLNLPGFLRKSTTSAISCLTGPYPATSLNVVFGFSVAYTFARLRPMFMTAPIWPCARRLIQMKIPMMSANGMTQMRIVPRMSEPARTYLKLTPFSWSWAISVAWKSLFGPELVNCVFPPCAVLNVPVIFPLSGSNSTLLTVPLSTAFWNCV